MDNGNADNGNRKRKWKMGAKLSMVVHVAHLYSQDPWTGLDWTQNWYQSERGKNEGGKVFPHTFTVHPISKIGLDLLHLTKVYAPAVTSVLTHRSFCVLSLLQQVPHSLPTLSSSAGT